MEHNARIILSERRIHYAVRRIFVEACVLLAPFARNNGRALNTSSYAMLNMVTNHFPELSQADAFIVIATVERLNRDGRLQILLDSAPTGD